MNAEQRLVTKNKEAKGGRLAMSKTCLVWLTVLALTGSFTSLNGLVINNEKVNEFIIPPSLSLKNASVDQKSSQFKNAKPQIAEDDFNSENFDKPTAVSSEYVAKGDKMLQPDAGNSHEKSKDKAQNYEIDLEKIRIENEKNLDKANNSEVNVEIPRVMAKKIIDKCQNCEIELEKLRIENKKLRHNAQYSEIELENLRIEGEKFIDKANYSESELEKLRIEYEKSTDIAQNSENNVKIPRVMAKNIIDRCQNCEIEAEKLRIENEKLRNNAQKCKVEVEKLRIENEKLRDNAQRFEIEVIKLRDDAHNSEVLVEKLRIDNEKSRGKAHKFEVKVELLKISNEELKAKAHNSEVEVEKFRIENEKLVDKAQYYELKVEKIRIENEKLEKRAQYYEAKVVKFREKANYYEVWVEELRIENLKLGEKAQNFEVEVEKLKISNEKLKAKAQNFEVEVKKLSDGTGKIKDNKEKSIDEAHKLPCEVGEKVDDAENFGDESQSSGDEAENIGEDAANAGGEAENAGDDAENSSDDAENSSDDADNSTHDADNSSHDADVSKILYAATCTGGFIREGDLCYLYIDRLETWDAAADHCRSLDAYLAEPRTQGQINFLKSVSFKRFASLWLGGTDQATEGKWVWAHSGAAVGGPTDWPTDWSPYQPDDWRSGEDCLEIRPVMNFKWNDVQCDIRRAFVCQKEITRKKNACEILQEADLFFAAAPGGAQEAIQLIDHFTASTADSQGRLRVSYIIDRCDGGENVALGQMERYCTWDIGVPEATERTNGLMMERVRTLTRQNRQMRAGPQVLVFFMNREMMAREIRRYDMWDNAQTLRDEGVEIVAVDLGGNSRRGVQVIQGVAGDRDNVVTFTQGSITGQDTARTNFVDKTCQALNRRRENPNGGGVLV